jgi:hypothetical protein
MKRFICVLFLCFSVLSFASDNSKAETPSAPEESFSLSIDWVHPGPGITRKGSRGYFPMKIPEFSKLEVKSGMGIIHFNDGTFGKVFNAHGLKVFQDESTGVQGFIDEEDTRIPLNIPEENKMAVLLARLQEMRLKSLQTIERKK